MSYYVVPIHHNHAEHPEYEGCFDSSGVQAVMVMARSGRYIEIIRTAANLGEILLSPGVYLLIDAGHGAHGQLFTMTDDGDIVQGFKTTPAVSKIHRWPPKS